MTAVSRTRAGRCRLSSVRLAVCVASLMMTAVLALEPSPPAASDWVHWRRPDKPRGWALLLPGAGGVRIFNDDRTTMRSLNAWVTRGGVCASVSHRSDGVIMAPLGFDGRPTRAVPFVCTHAFDVTEYTVNTIRPPYEPAIHTCA